MIKNISKCRSKSAANSDDANDCYLTTTAGKYVATTGSGEVSCAENGYCAGGNTIYVGGTVSGRKLHIGDNVMYLRSEKATTPSLNVSWGGQTYYGNMVETETNMSGSVDHKLKIKYKNNNKLYYVCDDTTCVQ